MANQVIANLLAGGHRDGKSFKSSVEGTIQPGLLVKQDSGGSTVSLGSPSSVVGFAYGLRYMVYRPTSKLFAIDEPLTVVWGLGEVLLSSDFFSGGSLPAAGDTLYAQANGLWGMSGSAKVGKCIKREPYVDPSGGTGTAVSLARVRFEIIP